MSIVSSNFSGNSAVDLGHQSGFGGAIYATSAATSPGTLTIERCNFDSDKVRRGQGDKAAPSVGAGHTTCVRVHGSLDAGAWRKWSLLTKAQDSLLAASGGFAWHSGCDALSVV